MVPPFLAYYGVITQDSSKLMDAYNQIKLYRTYLADPNANFLWKHIVFGSTITPDPGHWSTGSSCILFASLICCVQHAPLLCTVRPQGMAGPRPGCSAFSPPLCTLNTRTTSSKKYRTLQVG